MDNNLHYWDEFRVVPETAQKPISDGKLKGKTDINPVWRLKVLTEKFGPCGMGWHYVTKERWTDAINGELIANVRIELYIHPECAPAWPFPIEGIGGSKIYGHGKGQNADDEAWKMATTDAISVACKSLGVAADIYFSKDAAARWSKYDNQPSPVMGPIGQFPAPGEAPAPVYVPPTSQGDNTPAPAPAPAPAETVPAPTYTAEDLEAAKKHAAKITEMPQGIGIAPATYRRYVAGAAVGALTKSGAQCDAAYYQQYDPKMVTKEKFFQDVRRVRLAINNAKGLN